MSGPLPWQYTEAQKDAQLPYLPSVLQAAPGRLDALEDSVGGALSRLDAVEGQVEALDGRLGAAEETLAAATSEATPSTLALRDATGAAEFAGLSIDTTPAVVQTGAPGKMIWNDVDGTIEFQLKGGITTLQLGQEQVLRVRNAEATPLVDGEAVYISGSSGTHNTVLRASNTAEASSDRTLGIVTEGIAAHPGEGYITTFGMVRGLDTNHLTEGALVYLGVGGATTATKPTAPAHTVAIGYCVKKSGGAGAIFVHVTAYPELSELHDVLIGTQADGDILSWDHAASVWRNKAASAAPWALKSGDTFSGDVGITNNKALVMSQAAIYNLTRTVPTAVGNYIELASLTNTDFAANIEIWLNVHSNNFAQSKRYFMPLAYNGTGGAWQKALPISTTGAYVGNDVDLEIRVNLGVAYFRLRRSSGTTAGIADLVFILGGSANESTWTESTGTGVGVAPTAFYQVRGEGFNADYLGAGVAAVPFTNRPLAQVGNFPAVGGAYSLSSWAGTGVRVPFFAVCPSHNGGSVPAASQVVAVLGREGVNGQAYANFAEIKLRRYEHSGVNARTAMSIALTHGSNAASGTDVVDLRSDGTVALPNGSLVVPKTSGKGILVDPASPSYSWKDNLGVSVTRTTGVGAPTWTLLTANIYAWKMVNGDAFQVLFHMTHDLVQGSDQYIHSHWEHNGTAISGSLVIRYIYRYGRTDLPFTAEKTITQTVSTPNIATKPAYSNFVEEVQFSSLTGSATLAVSPDIYPDTVLNVRVIVDQIPTITGGSFFLHITDLHFQSTNVGTKQKNDTGTGLYI